MKKCGNMQDDKPGYLIEGLWCGAASTCGHMATARPQNNEDS